MAKWSVALFGYQKFIPDQQIDPEEHAAAIKRAKPGDIIAFKPWEERHRWTSTERTLFLIVTINGPTKSQMYALCEQDFDLDSYLPYNPKDYASWRADMDNRTEANPKAKAIWNSSTEEEKTARYNSYMREKKESARLPNKHKNKRRFKIDINDLQSKGVDIEKMLNKKIKYDPQPEFDYTEITDTIKGRKVNASDGLSRIKPLTDEELEARRV